ncbi:replication protein P [Vibrio rhizosphaerae]|uniref:Replication protein P n=1 Tax=Vibrio rhizosphaerae TaxID=398736 RepID=A0ABU4IXB0_9VIBR|nr:replication protein P [Vibrio rhizosphaerae]MDW6094031.1 replication protein P [Vibrio rhizosphaerae]
MKPRDFNQRPIGKEQPVKHSEPDQFAAQVVNMILRELRGIYPAWRNAVKSEKEYESVKRNYIKAMIEQGVNTMDLVQRGLRTARSSRTDFLPSPGTFCAWCLDDTAWQSAYQRMIRRKAPLNTLERVVRNDCEFDVRQFSEEKGRALFATTFRKWQRLQREGKLPEEITALPARSVTTDFDRERSKRGAPSPECFTGVFRRVAELGRRKEDRI